MKGGLYKRNMKKIFLVLVISVLAMSFLLAAKSDSELNSKLARSNSSVANNEAAIGQENGVVENRPGIGLGNTTRARIEERVRLNNLNLVEEFDNETNQTKLNTRLSNGRNAEIKVMPETASQKALEVLGTKCQDNCSIELKEVGLDNNTKLAYEYKGQAQVKVLGLFKARMRVQAQVDAETGEIIQSKRPWWSFLVSKEKSEEETQDTTQTTVENRSLE